MSGLGAIQRPSGTPSPTALLSILAALIGTVSVLSVAVSGFSEPAVALDFGAAIAVGEAMRLSLPAGRDSAPLAATASLGYALTVSVAGVPTKYGALQVIAVATVATIIGAAVQALAGRYPRPGYLARRVLVVAAVATVFRHLLLHGPARGLSDHHDPRILLFVVASVALGALALDLALATAVTFLTPIRVQPPQPMAFGRWDQTGTVAPRAERSTRRWLAALREECRAAARVYPTQVLFGVAVALAAGPLGLWAVPIAAGPVLIVHRSLRSYASISATYQQTIRALSRITELAGYTEPGHARRVCHLALAIGRDLSLSEPDLLDLEYAALLHDIGQLSLTDPIPGGATVLMAPDRAVKVASLGADVVRQTGVLDQVADILESQLQPYRAELADEPVRLAGAIIRAANAYDDLVGGALDPVRRLNAVKRIQLGIAAEYDPRVVESLTRIVEATEPYPG
jgi:hypothetical protein